jgi:hypothetical protein
MGLKDQRFLEPPPPAEGAEWAMGWAWVVWRLWRPRSLATRVSAEFWPPMKVTLSPERERSVGSGSERKAWVAGLTAGAGDWRGRTESDMDRLMVATTGWFWGVLQPVSG